MASPDITTPNTEAGTPAPRKAGTSRDATLYKAIAGVGANDGTKDLATQRAEALEAYERLELPVWRRSGFWTTSLKNLELDALAPRSTGTVPGALPELGARSGRIVINGDSVVAVELDDALRESGVTLCALADAPEDMLREHLGRRLPSDRDKLSAATAALWTAGVFLHVPRGVIVEAPFDLVWWIDEPGTAQYARTLIVGDEGSDFRVRHFELAPDFEGQALHAGLFEVVLGDGARARIAQVQDWGSGDVFDVSASAVTLGRDAYCHWLPCHLGGHLTREHMELAVAGKGADMAFRGIFFAEADEHLDLFAVDLHETGPSTGDVHWRGAATGTAKASYEGLIQIDPGAQQTHTYLQIHTMMLSPRAKVDAIPSVLVCSDDVSASHGGTVGEIDEAVVFYMRSRGLTRAQAVRQLGEGFFEPMVGELGDEALEEWVREKVGDKLSHAADDIEAYAAAR